MNRRISTLLSWSALFLTLATGAAIPEGPPAIVRTGERATAALSTQPGAVAVFLVEASEPGPLAIFGPLVLARRRPDDLPRGSGRRGRRRHRRPRGR